MPTSLETGVHPGVMFPSLPIGNTGMNAVPFTTGDRSRMLLGFLSSVEMSQCVFTLQLMREVGTGEQGSQVTEVTGQDGVTGSDMKSLYAGTFFFFIIEILSFVQQCKLFESYLVILSLQEKLCLNRVTQ